MHRGLIFFHSGHILNGFILGHLFLFIKLLVVSDIINFSCLLALKHYVLYSHSMISAQLQLTVLIRHYQELNDIILLFVSLIHNSEL